MTTITRERVAEIIHAAGLEPCDYEEVFSSIKTGEIVAMARIALASLKAEPVAWTDADELRDAKNGGNGYLFAIGGNANKFADPRRQMMLYAASPAPVTMQNDTDPRDAFEVVFPMPKHVTRCGKGYACTEYNAWGAHDFIRKWEGWSAAMLQGADGNSPVIPGGWVMVPVEPTAEMQSAAAGAIRLNTTPINKLWTGNAVYRAMLTAAPQQESV